MPQTSDVIIIGAGIAGTSVAAGLADQLSVTVLEMEDRPGYHSTGRSAAAWVPSYGPEVIRALTRASGDFLKRPPTEFNDLSFTTPRGEMVLGLPGEEEEIDAYRAIGMRDITGEEARERIPLLRTEAISSILVDETAVDIDVDALHQAYMRTLRKSGGHIICDAAAETISRQNGSWHVSTGKGEFAAPVIVNAAGAWGDEIAKRAGVRPVGLQPKRRSVAVVPMPLETSVDQWPLSINSREAFYFKPQSGKLLVSPADATPVDPHDAWADDMALAEAIDQFQRYVDVEVTRVEHTWGGLRTFAPDGDPVVGFDGAAEGFFWLTGQGGYGIQTAPALSRIAAGLIQGLKIPDDIAATGVSHGQLSPQRFR